MNLDIRLSIQDSLLYVDVYRLHVKDAKPHHEAIDPGQIPADCAAWCNFFDGQQGA